MRKLLAFLLLSASAFATTTVSGTLKDLSTGTVAANSFVRVYLRGCGGNQPRVNGTALISASNGATWFVDFKPNSSGVISGTVYSTRDAAGTGNGDIECGGSLTAVWYGVQVYYNGTAGPEMPVHAKSGATLDLTNVTPISTTPVVTAPTGDSTYARLDAGNMPFTGTVQAPSASISGALTVSTSETVTQPTYKSGAQQLNLAVGTSIFGIDDWGRMAPFGFGIMPGKYSTISGSFPLGNDNPILGTGPTDITFKHTNLVSQSQNSVTSGSEQTITLQLPAPIAGTFSAVGLNSGGSLAAATTYFLKATWVACVAPFLYQTNGLLNPSCTLGGETTASPELTVTTPASCSPANTCSVSVSFVGVFPTPTPDNYPGVGAYNLYSSAATGTEKLMASNKDVHGGFVMTAVGAGASVPVSNTALFPVTALLSTATHNGIYIDRGVPAGTDAKRELLLAGTCGALTSGQWCSSGTNTIHVFTAQNHTAPFDIDQAGSTVFGGDNLVFNCSAKPLGTGGLNNNPPLYILDTSNTLYGKIPCDSGVGNTFPNNAWQFNLISGLNGANLDTVLRHNTAASTTRIQSFAGIDLLTITNAGTLSVPVGNFFVTNITTAGAFSTPNANPATAGILRLASNDTGPTWRNNANSGNLALTKNTSDVLLYNGQSVSDGTHPAAIVVASGTSTFTTTAVTTLTCQTTVTTAATGALTTDAISVSYASAPGATTDSLLTLNMWVTAGNVNFSRCNPTAGSITPTALVLNWRVIR